MDYKQQILNDFYVDLFSTVYNDYPSVVQNAKTDILCENIEISFEDWLDELIDTYCYNNSQDIEAVKKAIEAEPQFKEDLKSEFDDLKEEVAEIIAETDEDED
jgi:hypothetical protein